MDSKLIIILAIILFILIILNHVSIIPTSETSTSQGSTNESSSISQQFGYIQTPTNCSNVPGCCSLTQYGCCPDGVNSRTNNLGSNCPQTYSQGYNTNPATTAAPVATTVATQPPPPPLVNIPPQNIIKPLPPSSSPSPARPR